MKERSKRQSFLGPDHEKVLAGCQVSIIGLGGGGSHIVQQLAHVGIGNFILIDHDKVEESNLNRLIGAKWSDVSKATPKTTVAWRLINGINPEAKVKAVCKKWEETAELLRDTTVIFGCVDSFQARHEIEIYARRYLIPYIDIGMDVHQRGDEFDIGGQVVLSMPGSLCLQCLGILTPERLAQESARYGAAGDRPQVVWSNGVLASLAVGVFVRLVTPWHKPIPEVVFLEYDGNKQEVNRSNHIKVLGKAVCHHFDAEEGLGDPFWTRARRKKGGWEADAE